MSDEFYRPTLTFPAPGAYNATQVRLYGIMPMQNMGIVFPQKDQIVEAQVDGANLAISITSGDKDRDDAFNAKAGALLESFGHRPGENDAGIFQGIVDGKFQFPVEIPLAFMTQVAIATKRMGTVALSASISLKQALESKKMISAGIIVAYAFEGHTYDLPKPKIMIIPSSPDANIPDDDSGFDKKMKHDYAVWIVDKLDECIEFEMNQGFVEQLVLEANLPGKRAPNMYAGRMMMGHRSGRLSE